jgi:hypothetical protein
MFSNSPSSPPEPTISNLSWTLPRCPGCGDPALTIDMRGEVGDIGLDPNRDPPGESGVGVFFDGRRDMLGVECCRLSSGRLRRDGIDSETMMRSILMDMMQKAMPLRSILPSTSTYGQGSGFDSQGIPPPRKNTYILTGKNGFLGISLGFRESCIRSVSLRL